MIKQTKNILFLIIFSIVFRWLTKNSEIKGVKKFTISLQITLLIMFGEVADSHGKDVVPGVHGFKSAISKRIATNPKLGAPQNFGKGVSSTSTNLSVTPAPSTNIQPLRTPQGLFGEINRGPSGSLAKNDVNSKSHHFKKTLPPKSVNPKYKNRRDLSEAEVLEGYQSFMEDMKAKGYNIDISEKRFLELCKNPQTGKVDENSLFETQGALELEAKGMVKNLRRPSNPNVHLDFMAELVDSGKTIFIDHKGMMDFENLTEMGINISKYRKKYRSHEKVAFSMAKKSIQQKVRFLGMEQGPATMEEVVHLYNFQNIRNKLEIPLLLEAFFNVATLGGTTEGILFINCE